MNLPKLLMWGLVGWTLVGMLGIVLSLVRKERAKARRGMAWMAGVWMMYLGVLVGVSLKQPQKVMAFGQERCFDEMCFTVIKVERMPGFPAHDDGALVRMSVEIKNKDRGGVQSEKRMHAYLLDSKGRRWDASTGVSGVPLTTKVMAGGSVTSELVFKVAKDSTRLDLVFTRGSRYLGALVIGDSDSWLHRRTVVRLDR